MIFKLCVALLCFLFVVAGGCGSNRAGGDRSSAPAIALQPPPAVSPPTHAAPAAPDAGTAATPSEDACSLLDAAEVARVQGARVSGVVPSSRPQGGLAVSQCFYTVISADGSKNLSVHVEVIRSGQQSIGQNAVKEFWEGMFRRGKDERGEREREERAKAEREEGEESAPPRPVHGIGDEAFWMGSSRMGALYVLKRDKLLRVSVGGPDDAETKMEKSRALAKKALARLR